MGDHLSAYGDALAYLFARTTGKSKFGLTHTLALLSALGDPHLAVPCFHVAGTNGKGSVCATLEAILRARGLRVGKYTSPHLVDFRERVVVDGIALPESYVTDFVARRRAVIEELGTTFFEATTAMAFQYFVDTSADVAVIETGLGGRLDSTNVVRPLVAGVSSIGIDHVEYLGDTLEEIAFEKAGIYKAGVVAASGEPDPRIDALLAEHAARHQSAGMLSVWRDAPPRQIEVGAHGTRFSLTLDGATHTLCTPLAGAHQASNATLALLMLRAAGDRYWRGWDGIAEALQGVRLPGRFHVAPPYIFDVAHNPAGVETLVRTLMRVRPSPPVVAVLCILGDKDWRAMLHMLAPAVSHFVLTDAPTAPTGRSWVLDEAERYAEENGWSSQAEPDFDAALRVARNRAGTVLVTGSFHTVGDAMARLQVDPLAG